MDKYDKLILGDGAVYNTNPGETALNRNVVVVGGSGSGKTLSVLEPRLIETYNDSLIVSVSKNKLVPKYTEMFKERGYQVKYIDFADPSKSTAFYEPLAYVRTYHDIKHLAESIVNMTEKSIYSSADPYWDSVCVSLLCAEIGYCLATISNPKFTDVLDLHDKLTIDGSCSDMIHTNLHSDFELLPRDHFARRCWNSFKDLPVKTAECAFSSLNVLIDSLFLPEIRNAMRDCESIDITELAREKTVLFVTTSPVNKSLHGLANLFISQAIKDLFGYAEEQPDSALPIHVQFLCDDFACQRIAHFDEYISIFREKNISAILLLQSESQLSAMYSERAATTIINNCDSFVYLGSNDIISAHNISKRANVPLEDVLTMPVGKEWIFRRGAKPLYTNRYRITDNEIYKEVARRYEKNISAMSAKRVHKVRPRTKFYLY